MFQNLTKQGILLDSFYAVTHPSEPNYIAAIGGDFFGAMDDNFCECQRSTSESYLAS